MLIGPLKYAGNHHMPIAYKGVEQGPKQFLLHAKQSKYVWETDLKMFMSSPAWSSGHSVTTGIYRGRMFVVVLRGQVWDSLFLDRYFCMLYHLQADRNNICGGQIEEDTIN